VRGEARFRGGRWRLDDTQNLGTLISQQIILDELQDFLARHYPAGGDSAAPDGSVLDLGAGSKPYAPLYDSHFSTSTAVDVDYSPHDTSRVDLLAPAERLPFDDASFDCVICTEVLEHCRDPRAVMAEIARVLNGGGRAFLTTPFFVPLHEMPHDYYRFTPFALEDLAAVAGLSVVSIIPRGGYVPVLLRLLQMPITKFWQKLSRVLRLPLSSAYNPVLFCAVVLPEKAYLAFWRRGRRRRRGGLGRILANSSRHTLGYVTELEKAE
jgi:ubiquinone/menaquinone biosynthesis C-methylase UbiE